MYYLSMARAPDEADMVYAHKLHKQFAYEPKLSPYVVSLWLGSFQRVFCLHDLNFYYETFKTH